MGDFFEAKISVVLFKNFAVKIDKFILKCVANFQIILSLKSYFVLNILKIFQTQNKTGNLKNQKVTKYQIIHITVLHNSL